MNADMDYEDSAVAEAKREGSHWTIKKDDGWTLACCSVADVEAAGIAEVVPGDRVRIWPGRIGSFIRGVAINGRTIFYRTAQEQDEKNRADAAAEDRKREDELEASRAERDATRAALPEVFQRRLRRFEDANPTWRRDFETYELSCCTDAVKIAAACGTDAGVVAFAKKSCEEQRSLVPDLFDGHSGNSFGFAVRLARHYVTTPENVVREHGALCPLVGCEAYGDHGKESRDGR